MLNVRYRRKNLLVSDISDIHNFSSSEYGWIWDEKKELKIYCLLIYCIKSYIDSTHWSGYVIDARTILDRSDVGIVA